MVEMTRKTLHRNVAVGKKFSDPQYRKKSTGTADLC